MMQIIKKGGGWDSNEEEEGGNIQDVHEYSMMDAYKSWIENNNDDVEAAVMENEYINGSSGDSRDIKNEMKNKLWVCTDDWATPKPYPNLQLKKGNMNCRWIIWKWITPDIGSSTISSQNSKKICWALYACRNGSSEIQWLWSKTWSCLGIFLQCIEVWTVASTNNDE